MGLVLERLLRHELKVCKSVGDIRGRGLFWGVEFVKDLTSKRPFDPSAKFGLLVQQIAFEKGVALYPGGATIDGVNGDHILLAPPFTITEDQLATICRVLKEAVVEAETMMLSP
jgi:adenosylmethionine-8-amino-7-oxononanoate aminotransferase